MKLKNILCILCVWPLFLVKGGTVRLLNGESYEAKLAIESGGITATRDKSFGNRIDPNNILELVFDKDAGSTCPPGFLLINGTFLPGEVRLPGSLEETTVKIAKTQISFPITSVARMVYKPIPAVGALKPLFASTGALLPNGDFAPGAYEGIKDGKVAINTPIVGPQRLSLIDGVGGIVLRDLQVAGARFEVFAKDGTRYLTDELRFEGEGIAFHDTIIGQRKITKDELGAIRAVAGRYHFLSRLRPGSVDTPDGATDAVRSLPGGPADADQTQAILSAVNATVNYNVPAGMNRFGCRIMIPKEVPPAARFSFAVYLDGKMIVR